MHEVLVNRIGSLSLLRKSMLRLTDRPDLTLAVYRGCKTTIQQQQHNAEIQIRGGIEDNSEIICLISQQKHMS